MIEESVSLLLDAFSGKRSKEAALKEVVASFEAIDIYRERKPKVAIFGDLYVRDNDVMNQNLIRFIEKPQRGSDRYPLQRLCADDRQGLS